MSRRRLFQVFCVSAAVLGTCFFAVILTGALKLFSIPTNGMSPTIQSGDRIIATSILDPSKTVTRGDIVVFNANRANPLLKGRYVQRVVALGGDKVERIDGQLRVNGAPIPEREGIRFTPAKQVPPGYPALTYPLMIPTGSVFTLGDNDGNSLDSRYFGPFPIDTVTHSADCIVFPVSRAGALD